MSVTFYLESTETLYPTCPRCKSTLRDPAHIRTGKQDCPEIDPLTGMECLSFGFQPIKNGPELNVSNQNAVHILMEFGTDISEGLFGELDPEAVLASCLTGIRIASMGVLIADGGEISVREESATETEARTIRYAKAFYRIATIAKRRREKILFS